MSTSATTARPPPASAPRRRSGGAPPARATTSRSAPAAPTGASSATTSSTSSTTSSTSSASCSSILGKPLDAFAVVFVIAANTVISLFQEIRAKRVMDQMAILMRPKADVLRDGELREIDPSQVVLGDVLRARSPATRSSSTAPWSARAAWRSTSRLLTGESDLVTKHPGDELLSGSFCVTGGGYYEAEQVGLDSFANKLTAKAKAFKRELTPLQRQVVQIVRVLLIVVIVFEILVWVRNVAGGVPFVESVRMSTVILALIPNGLVLTIALTYALGAVRLLGKDVLVQQFNAVETLSNVDVLCTDKTGTLTSGVDRRSRSWRPLGADDGARERACSAPSPPAPPTPTGRSRRSAPRSRRSACTAAHEAFFSSDRKWSGLAFDDGEARGTYVLGAPEMLAPALARRRRLARAGRRVGGARPARRALRRAATSRSPSATTRTARPSCPTGLEALALVCFSDELRPGVRETLEEFSDAASTSRSSPATTRRRSPPSPRRPACSRCGAARAWTRTATWCAADGRRRRRPARRRDAGTPRRPRDGRRAAPPARARRRLRRRARRALARGVRRQADEAGIFGRVTPEQKQDLVEALRDRGRYVAMIGDGVNDVIALKQANVAVAMQGGSQAARSVGDLILMKDTFAPLPFAFREGQRIINGMNDILRIFMVRIFFKAPMIAIVTAIGGFPFAPRQSALLSFFGATVPAIAFALWAQPGPDAQGRALQAPGALRAARPSCFMTAIGTGVYLAWSIPAKNGYLAAHPGADRGASSSPPRYPQAMTALTIFACFAAIFLILLIVPPTQVVGRRRPGGAQRLAHGRRGRLPVRSAWSCVLAVPLGRTLFEITALPWWQYFVLLGLAFVWSQLCLLVWKSAPARPLAGHGRGPGQRVREGGGRSRAKARRESCPARLRRLGAGGAVRRARPTGTSARAGTPRRPAAGRGRCGGRAARSPRARRRPAPRRPGRPAR